MTSAFPQEWPLILSFPPLFCVIITTGPAKKFCYRLRTLPTYCCYTGLKNSLRRDILSGRSRNLAQTFRVNSVDRERRRTDGGDTSSRPVDWSIIVDMRQMGVKPRWVKQSRCPSSVQRPRVSSVKRAGSMTEEGRFQGFRAAVLSSIFPGPVGPEANKSARREHRVLKGRNR